MHTAGLGELVAVSLTADLNGQVLYSDDSAVMISTRAQANKIGTLSYIKNSFVVIGSVPRRQKLGQSIDGITREIGRWSLPRSRRPYRLMFSEDGQLAGVPGNSRSRLESAVGRATGARLMPRGGGDEYWTITRRDLEEVLFCQRIPAPRRRQPAKGGLAPDIAELIVNAVGKPRSGDVVLDPFAGTGALIAARTQKPFREAICSDLGYRNRAVQLLPELARRQGVRSVAEDARILTSIPDDAVDLVITDPPWGEFDQGIETDSLIAEALVSMRRVLRPGGKIAMLVARRLARDVKDLWLGNDFRLRRSYDLLVNGHPATLLVGSAAQE
ncbi:MAG TPA: methyltransferase [Microlunatus sp.]